MELKTVGDALGEIQRILATHTEQPEVLPELQVAGQPVGFGVIAHLTAGTTSRSFFKIDPVGRQTPVPLLPPDNLWLLLGVLRDMMYRQDTGTWFSTVITVRWEDGDLRGQASFDYDNEPPFAEVFGEVDPVAYFYDGLIYPRSAANIPAWFRAYVAAGEARVHEQAVPQQFIDKFTQDRLAWVRQLHETCDPD